MNRQRGAHLKRARQNANLSLTDAAALADTSESYISQLELGFSIPEAEDLLARLTNIYSVAAVGQKQ